MKILTILGTRPEIIRLSRIIEKLDALGKQVLVHTGQNFDANLSDIIFEQLGLRPPDHHLGARGSFGEQLAVILSKTETILKAEKPDRFLVLGDTNSSLAAVVAKRLHIPVYHMEAGNRCFDDRVPEEVNRRVIDHSSDVLLPYTERARMNLLREGIPGERIHVTGNPIREIIESHRPKVAKSNALAGLNLRPKRYFLATIHREENVDVPDRLKSLVDALRRVQKKYALPVIVSTHPRTRLRLDESRLRSTNKEIRFLPPFGFFEFIALEEKALCVLSDSGTVQEECCIFRVPNVTLRDVTERPETVECGSNMLGGADPGSVLKCVQTMLGRDPDWRIPPEYLVRNVSDTVAKIIGS
jgi:UDP-N-acetylglucosamine 2-epimerase (non-hydrolysing)